MNKLILCDTHCDTASACLDTNQSLFKNNLHIDLLRLSKYKHYTQFFAAFSITNSKISPYKRCKKILNFIISECQKHSDKVILSKCCDDIKASQKENKISAFLSIEGGEAIYDLSALKEFYNLGVRMLTLTWNYDNIIGGGALGNGRGLSDFGKSVVLKMQDMNMITDLSHANEKTFYDVLEITKKPVILSHSDSFTLCPNKRNITDNQFISLINNGGVCGINIYPLFLTNTNNAKVSDIISHIEHFLSLGGENNICIGTDFDGINSLPHNICGVQDIYKLYNELARHGISDDIIQKIAYKNLYRVLSICL